MNNERAVRVVKRIIKYSAIGLISFVGLALIANAIWIQITGRQVANRLAKVRAAGEPTSWEELIAKTAESNKNEQFYPRSLREEVDVLDRELYRITKNGYHRTGQLSDDEVKKLEVLFAGHDAVFQATKNASDRKKWYSATDTPFPANGEFSQQYINALTAPRALIGVLRTRHAYLIRTGAHQEAFETALNALQITQLEGATCSMNGGVMRVVMRSIACDMANQILRIERLTPAQHERLDAELSNYDVVKTYRDSLQSERLVGIFMLRNRIPWSKYWISRGLYNQNLIKYLDLLELELASSVDLQSLTRPPDLKAAAKGWILMELLVPAVEMSRSAALKSECQLRALRVLNAIVKSGKQESDSLDITQLGLPSEVTTDPYTGKPLLLKKAPEGWTVYSVGPNLVDDGGDVNDKARKDENGKEVIRAIDFGWGPKPSE